VLAGAVVGDVGLDGDDDSEGRRRLVPKVRLHHCLLLLLFVFMAGLVLLWFFGF